MFYSDGITLYDATNAPMDGHPIGGLGGCNSAAMVIAFCKVPTKCNQYYVFTNRTGDVANCGTPQINVYIVDMTGNSGLGHILALGEWDVVPSDNILTTNASETMMTIPGSNPDEYWLVGRRPNGNMFSYKIDAAFQSNFLAGSTANLVTSTIGLPGSTSYNMEYSGNASVSNNIAMIFSSFNNTLYTMKFDNSSGSFSEATLRASNLGGTGYDVEFSQDASKLYYSTYTNYLNLYQYDLITTTQTLLHSETISTVKGGGLKRGPDNKIYFISNFASNYLGVIQNPDNAGILCNYNNTGLQFTFSGGWGALNFPNTLPAATISNVYDYQICQGSSITLTETGGVSYQWVPGTGLNATNTASVVATPTSDISYYSIIIDANNCATYNQHNIDVVPNTIQNLSATYTGGSPLCSGDPVTISASGTNVDNYTISPGSSASFTNSITLNPISTTTYTITAHQGICSASTQLTVNVSDCQCTGGIPITATSILGYMQGTAIVLPDLLPTQYYVINQTLTLPSNVTAVNIVASEVRFAPGVELIVPANVELGIQRSYLHACNSMWKGIRVDAGGAIKTSGEDNNGRPSLIEDAIIAVNYFGSNLNKVLETTNTVFNKNQTDIRVNTYNPNVFNYQYFKIENTVFTCRDMNLSTAGWEQVPFTMATIKGNYSFDALSQLDDQQIPENSFSSTSANAYLKAPFAGTKSSYGIFLNNVGVTNNNNTANPSFISANLGNNTTNLYNLFDNHLIGIQANSSNVNIVNAQFQNIKSWPGALSGSVGKGIVTSTLKNMKKRINIQKTRHTNCNYAIDVNDYFDITISNNLVKSTQHLNPDYSSTALHPGQYGIHVRSNSYKQADINYNLMYNIETGIVFNSVGGPNNNGTSEPNTTYSGVININNNSIQADYDAYLSSLSYQYVKNAIIADCIFGTTYQNAPTDAKLTISDNLLKEVYRGIFVNNWKKQIHIQTNTIEKLRDCTPVDPNLLMVGIEFNNNSTTTALRNVIRMNVITGFGYSNQVTQGISLSNSRLTNLTCNETADIYTGLEFNGSCTGTRTEHNKMKNHHFGFCLNNSANIGQQGNDSAPIVTQRWACDNEYALPWPSGHYMTATIGSSTSQLSRMFLHNNNFGTYTYNPNSSGFSNSASPVNDVYGQSNGSIDYVTNLEVFPITCAVLIPVPGGTNNLSNEREQLRKIVTNQVSFTVNPIENNYIFSKQAFELLQENPALMENEPEMQAFEAQNLNSNKHKFNLIEEALASENVTLASNLLNTVASAEVLDANYLGLYNVIKNMYQDSIVHPEDSLYLIQLATGCPFTDGMVVYQARSLYGSLYGYHTIFRDACNKGLEDGEKSLISYSSSPIIKNEPNLYPNPSEGSFIIYYDKKIVSCLLYDQVGKLISVEYVDLGNNTYQLSEKLSKGMYTLSLTDENNVSYVKKIVVQ